MSDEPEYYASLLAGAPSWAIDQVREEADSLRARVAELEALVQRTLWHADNALLVLPPEMVREFRDAMEGKG